MTQQVSELVVGLERADGVRGWVNLFNVVEAKANTNVFSDVTLVQNVGPSRGNLNFEQVVVLRN